MPLPLAMGSTKSTRIELTVRAGQRTREKEKEEEQGRTRGEQSVGPEEEELREPNAAVAVVVEVARPAELVGGNRPIMVGRDGSRRQENLTP